MAKIVFTYRKKKNKKRRGVGYKKPKRGQGK